jgi:hypothetical protein
MGPIATSKPRAKASKVNSLDPPALPGLSCLFEPHLVTHINQRARPRLHGSTENPTNQLPSKAPTDCSTLTARLLQRCFPRLLPAELAYRTAQASALCVEASRVQ